MFVCVCVCLCFLADNFELIAALLRIVTGNPDLFSTLDSGNLSQLVGLIQGKTTPAIAVEAVSCLTALSIYFYPDEKRRNCFAPILGESYLPALLQAAQADPAIAVQLWTSAGDLVFECPRLFASKKQGSALLGKYLSLAASVLHSVPADEYGADEDGVASAALEFVCAAVEGSPTTFKRERGLLEASAVLLLQVTGMEDGSDDWLHTDPTDEGKNFHNCDEFTNSPTPTLTHLRTNTNTNSLLSFSILSFFIDNCRGCHFS